MTSVPSRLPAIDALRGFALFGILVVNMAVFHSGIGGMNLGGSLGATGWRNSATDAVIVWLFTGKFILIFSFLFGWGIHTQAARDGAFRARYLRRLLGLFAIGAIHASFFVFRIGPLEWMLRSITEWRWVSLRPRRAADAAPA